MILLIFITIMITLKFTGLDCRRGGLRQGMYVNVPTNWATDSVGGNVTKDAISEIMEVLDDKYITIPDGDYDHVFSTYAVEEWRLSSAPLRPGRRAGKALLYWEKV